MEILNLSKFITYSNLQSNILKAINLLYLIRKKTLKKELQIILVSLFDFFARIPLTILFPVSVSD